MKTAPDTYGAWRPISAAGQSEDPFLSHAGHINAEADDVKPAGAEHKTASCFMKSVYVALLVVFGSGMTLIISAQDRYCIHNCYERPETYLYPDMLGFCASVFEWKSNYTADCNNGFAYANSTTTPPLASGAC